MRAKWEGVWVRQDVPHLADCCAVRNTRNGTWKSPWVLPVYDFAKFDSALRKSNGASTMVLRYRCNDSDCPAGLIVATDFSERLPTGFVARPGKEPSR